LLLRNRMMQEEGLMASRPTVTIRDATRMANHQPGCGET
jgi:hypothetical protein